MFLCQLCHVAHVAHSVNLLQKQRLTDVSNVSYGSLRFTQGANASLLCPFRAWSPNLPTPPPSFNAVPPHTPTPHYPLQACCTDVNTEGELFTLKVPVQIGRFLLVLKCLWCFSLFPFSPSFSWSDVVRRKKKTNKPVFISVTTWRQHFVWFHFKWRLFCFHFKLLVWKRIKWRNK